VIELASHYGNQTEVYNGIDLTVNARVKKVFVTGGLNTGRLEVNNCDIAMNYPQVTATVSGANYAGTRIPAFCDLVTPMSAQTQVKLAVIYDLPWDIHTSATMQVYPGITPSAGGGTNSSANLVYTNAQILPSLGRNLASCGAAATCNGTSIVNVLPANQIFEKGYSQFDLRLAKGVKIARARVQGIMDLFNAFNSRPVLSDIARYSGATGGSWLSPTSTLVGRLIKFSAQPNF
jgi:hypothetical protein